MKVWELQIKEKQRKAAFSVPKVTHNLSFFYILAFSLLKYGIICRKSKHEKVQWSFLYNSNIGNSKKEG